jgi:acyl carrier protein
MERKICIDDNNIKVVMGRAWGINPNEIPQDVKFNDFPQWDSLGHVNLLVELEKEYNISINYKTLTELTSIHTIIKYLKDEAHVG